MLPLFSLQLAWPSGHAGQAPAIKNEGLSRKGEQGPVPGPSEPAWRNSYLTRRTRSLHTGPALAPFSVLPAFPEPLPGLFPAELIL